MLAFTANTISPLMEHSLKRNVLFLKEEHADGQEKYSYSDGASYEGEWKNGKRCNGSEYNKYGKIIGKYVNRKYKK